MDTGLFHWETPPLGTQLPKASSKALGPLTLQEEDQGTSPEMQLSQVPSGQWVLSTPCTFCPAFPGPRTRPT